MAAALGPIDLAVRRQILATCASGGTPTRQAVAEALEIDRAHVDASYGVLAATHVVVLDPKSGEVWMAMPFSAVPTAFPVVAGGRALWANCAWDAFGLAAALDEDVSFVTPCPASNASIAGGVRHGVAYAHPGAVGYVGVPAAQWWDDIGFT